MKLRFYRLMEAIFSIPSAFFGDKADEIDTELHDRLRERMEEIRVRRLKGDA